MINEAEGELENEFHREAVGFVTVVPVGEGLGAQVEEPAEAALVVVFQDAAHANARAEIR